MQRYVIYVAGPFRARDGQNQWEQTQNIRRAEEAALRIWGAGHVAICPHLNTVHFQGALPDDVWLSGDLEIVKRCDGVLLVGDWKNSAGSRKEVLVSEENGIPCDEILERLIESITVVGKWAFA